MARVHFALSFLLISSLSYGAEFERITNQVYGSKAEIESSFSGIVTSSKTRSIMHTSMALKSETVDQKKFKHTRYQQLIGGTPIWTAEVVHHDKGGKHTLSGKRLTNVNSVAKYSFEPEQVREYIEKQYFSKFKKYQDTKIVIQDVKPYWYLLPDQDLVPAYYVDAFITGENLITRPQLIIQADSYNVLKKWEGLNHLEVEATGPGGNQKTGRYDYGVDYDRFPVQESNGVCSMENEHVKAVNLDHSLNDELDTAFSYNCASTDSYQNTFKEINGAYSPINDAYFFGNLVFDMYQEWYSEAPIPVQLEMKVHYGSNHDNAYWTGTSMLFGDGAELFYPLVDINVVAHEVSHGYTNFNSDLIYVNQSGGMNEAFSDMAGEAAEYYLKGNVDWLVGADITRGDGALRYFEDPTEDGVSIGHIDDYFDGMNVHFSSGIYNRAFYLLANSEGWNIKKSFDVFVNANKHYWIADETFQNGVCGVVHAAEDLGYSLDPIIESFQTVGLQCPGYFIDADGDGVDDYWESDYGLSSQNPDDVLVDYDRDGLNARQEFESGTKPDSMDSDNDGIDDQLELSLGTDPKNADSDADGMADGFEVQFGLNPKLDDSKLDKDGDSLNNITEFVLATNPAEKGQWIPRLNNFNENFESEISSLWKLDSEYSWEKTDSASSQGSYSLNSVDIGNNQSSVVALTVPVLPGATITFDLKTSTEYDWDFFFLVINNEIVYEQSGQNDWASVSYEFTNAGLVNIQFVYAKDDSVSDYDDKVWIDNVEITSAPDENSNGIADYWEAYFSISDLNSDSDNDGLSALDEYSYQTSPILLDTDGDSLSDYDETQIHKTNPLLVDSDGDAIPDSVEVNLNLDPNNGLDGSEDLDGDGVSNRLEAYLNSEVNNAEIKPELLASFTDDFESNEVSSGWGNVFSWLVMGDVSYKTWQLSGGQLVPEAMTAGQSSVVYFSGYLDRGEISFDYGFEPGDNQDLFNIQFTGIDEIEYLGNGSEGRMTLNVPEPGAYVLRLEVSNSEETSHIIKSAYIDSFRFDADSDGDGVFNETDVFPYDASESSDIDGDGVGDNSDAFPNNASESRDTDGDGVGDYADYYPNDPSKSKKESKSEDTFLGLGYIPWYFVLGLLMLALRQRKVVAATR